MFEYYFKKKTAKQEMTRMNLNILGMAEVRWIRTEIYTSSNKTIIYSGAQVHFRGVSIVFDKESSKAIRGHRAISNRVVVGKLQGKPWREIWVLKKTVENRIQTTEMWVFLKNAKDSMDSETY